MEIKKGENDNDNNLDAKLINFFMTEVPSDSIPTVLLYETTEKKIMPLAL